MNYLIKDITTVESPAIIIHGVNCQHIMRSGVAQAIYLKWPKVIRRYMYFARQEMFLGKVDPVEIDEQFFVLNCWTQENYGYDDAIYASASAIETCLETAMNFAIEKNIKNIYSPRIGCGLGGLSWEKDISPIFSKIEKKYPNIKITICDLN